MDNKGFNNQVKSYLGVKYSYSYWKGRVALYALLEVLDLDESVEVIIPGFTCVVVPNAIKYLGIKPVYVDIYEKTLNIDPNLIEEKITSRTRVIIIQNTFGLPPDYDAILPIAQKYNLKVIEDCAHGFGSKYKGKLSGTLTDAAFFSTQWNKPFSTGLGGFAVTNNQEIGEILRENLVHYKKPSLFEQSLLWAELIAHKYLLTPSLYWKALKLYRSLSYLGIIPGSSSSDELAGRMPKGYKKAASPVRSNWGQKALAGIDANLKHRKEVASQYDRIMDDLGIPKPFQPDYAEHSFLRYSMLVKDRKVIMAEAQKRRIEIGEWFNCVLHPEGAPLEELGYRKGTCPVAERVAEHIINLPTHQKIKEKEVSRIRSFLQDMKAGNLI